MRQDELIALEEEAGRHCPQAEPLRVRFYERVLDPTVVMLLPGGMVLDERAAIVDSVSGQP